MTGWWGLLLMACSEPVPAGAPPLDPVPPVAVSAEVPVAPVRHAQMDIETWDPRLDPRKWASTSAAALQWIDFIAAQSDLEVQLDPVARAWIEATPGVRAHAAWGEPVAKIRTIAQRACLEVTEVGDRTLRLRPVSMDSLLLRWASLQSPTETIPQIWFVDGTDTPDRDVWRACLKEVGHVAELGPIDEASNPAVLAARVLSGDPTPEQLERALTHSDPRVTTAAAIQLVGKDTSKRERCAACPRLREHRHARVRALSGFALTDKQTPAELEKLLASLENGWGTQDPFTILASSPYFGNVALLVGLAGFSDPPLPGMADATLRLEKLALGAQANPHPMVRRAMMASGFDPARLATEDHRVVTAYLDSYAHRVLDQFLPLFLSRGPEVRRKLVAELPTGYWKVDPDVGAELMAVFFGGVEDPDIHVRRAALAQLQGRSFSCPSARTEAAKQVCNAALILAMTRGDLLPDPYKHGVGWWEPEWAAALKADDANAARIRTTTVTELLSTGVCSTAEKQQFPHELAAVLQPRTDADRALRTALQWCAGTAPPDSLWPWLQRTGQARDLAVLALADEAERNGGATVDRLRGLPLAELSPASAHAWADGMAPHLSPDEWTTVLEGEAPPAVQVRAMASLAPPYLPRQVAALEALRSDPHPVVRDCAVRDLAR